VAEKAGPKPDLLPEDAFEKGAVVGVIKRGNEVWTYEVEGVTQEEGKRLTVRYRANSVDGGNAKFASPLIVSVPKDVPLSHVVFYENGKKAAEMVTELVQPRARKVFDFSEPEAARAWQPVNDGVMGGVSDGRFRITDEGTMVFFGTLSLENNGGFASVRSRRGEIKLKPDDTLLIRLRGDGRDYLLNLYVPTLRMAYSYRAAIPTKKGEWTEVKIPLRDCQATSFGEKVAGGKPVDAAQVNSLGFMLADKKAGPFELEVAWVKAIGGDGGAK
jgi:monofunctional biosynthetic peptidoglycan transglycosylase